MKKILFISALLILSFSSCNKEIEKTVKLSDKDPFKNSITPSELFEINGNEDNVVQGKNGTKIVCPKGSWLDGNGNAVNDKISVELAEGLSLDEMVLSNLTTTSQGKLLESGGMIYLNATSNGKQLKIDPNNPIYIEMPSPNPKPGMMAWKGTRDENGNMNWTEPKALENYLVTVDLKDLDFLPPGFESEVFTKLPLLGHKTQDEKFTDSIYYALSNYKPGDYTRGLHHTELNEAFYNPQSQVINGKYTNRSFDVSYPRDTIGVDSIRPRPCVIDPAKIKVLKSKEYQKTFIATREFEARLRLIHASIYPHSDALEAYTKNLDKNLWECDELAASYFEGSSYQRMFLDFAAEKKGKVKDGEKYADILKGFFEKKFEKTKKELEEKREKVLASLKKKNDDFNKVADEYKELLWKREEYRMTGYGFTWTNTGWLNIDTGVVAKNCEWRNLEVKIKNGSSMDRTYCYVVFPSTKSLYKLNDKDKSNFWVGNEMEKQMIMPKNSKIVCISIGYKGEQVWLNAGEISAGKNSFECELSESNKNELKKALAPYEESGRENSIKTDLTFQREFHEEKIRQENLRNTGEKIDALHWFVWGRCFLDGISMK